MCWKAGKDIEIAAAVGCSTRTLTDRFFQFLDKGRANLKERLRKRQIKAALAGNVTMLIWLGKQYLGQKDRTDVTSGDEKIGVEVVYRNRVFANANDTN